MHEGSRQQAKQVLAQLGQTTKTTPRLNIAGHMQWHEAREEANPAMEWVPMDAVEHRISVSSATCDTLTSYL